jgi:hypothetical protein
MLQTQTKIIKKTYSENKSINALCQSEKCKERENEHDGNGMSQLENNKVEENDDNIISNSMKSKRNKKVVDINNSNQNDNQSNSKQNNENKYNNTMEGDNKGDQSIIKEWESEYEEDSETDDSSMINDETEYDSNLDNTSNNKNLVDNDQISSLLNSPSFNLEKGNKFKKKNKGDTKVIFQNINSLQPKNFDKWKATIDRTEHLEADVVGL